MSTSFKMPEDLSNAFSLIDHNKKNLVLHTKTTFLNFPWD